VESVQEILAELRRRRVSLWVEGGRLRCKPTEEGLPEALLAELRARSQEIVGFLADAAPAESSNREVDAIPRRAESQSPALSIVQEGLWYLAQLNPGSGHYNGPMGFRFAGPLDVAVLRRSLNEIVSRHESLRTILTLSEGRPVQTILPELVLDVPVVDLSDREASSRAEESARLLAEAASEPFDLATGPLVGAFLIRHAADEHVLCLVTHHIVFDGWSAEILRRELSALYEAFAAGRPSPLEPLPIQYADFSDWHGAWCESEEAKRQLEYWTDRLSGELPVLELPADRPRPAAMSFTGSTRSLRVSRERVDALSKLAQGEGATLFMGLLAVYETLLHRYSGQEDILVGSPMLGRPRQETEGVIGFFTNPVVVRSRVTGELSFRELLGRVRRDCLDAYAHQETPFEHVVEALGPERDLSRTPVFQTMFSFQDIRQTARSIGDVTMEPVRISTGASRTDLTAFMYHGADGLEVVLEYATELFDPETVDRLLGHFAQLLDEVVRDPEARIGEPDLLTGAEKQALSSWNDTEAPFFDGCLHELFEQQVAMHAESVAVESGTQRLTYAELDARANALACHLQAQGLGPGEMVGICLERSEQMLVGLLGILKSGAAYLPLDPEFPVERLGFMLEDSGARLVVTERRLSEELLPAQTQTVCLDDAEEALSAHAGERPESRAAAEDLAYVIYTSGSTGKPKGVQVPHRAVSNFLSSMAREPGLTSSDGLLAVTTISFDISVLELFLPLSVGARVVVASAEVSSDGPQLLEELARSRATVMQATPATWRMLVESGWSGGDGLRVLCGGEALSSDLASELLRRSDAVWNLYGPTETTIWSTCRRLSPETAVTVGGPIANTRVHILDRFARPVPVGVAGDLYIGGAGVTKGYLGRPELTAERFVADPVGDDGVVYRTGDRARWRPDGCIEYLEREDTQVKVRGYRIELGEIESVLDTHPQIAQSVAVVREFGPQDHRIVAYFRPEPGAGEAPTATELRAHLRLSLPAYMLPSTFVELSEFPLTPNGKVDRKRLPEPEMYRSAVGREYVAPQSDLEKAMATVWQELLGIDQVGVTDNFFDLGGHSLLSMKASYQIEQAVGVRSNARDMLMLTLGQLAALAVRDDAGKVEERAGRGEQPAGSEPAAGGDGAGLFSRLKRVIAGG